MLYKQSEVQPFSDDLLKDLQWVWRSLFFPLDM